MSFEKSIFLIFSEKNRQFLEICLKKSNFLPGSRTTQISNLIDAAVFLLPQTLSFLPWLNALGALLKGSCCEKRYTNGQIQYRNCRCFIQVMHRIRCTL